MPLFENYFTTFENTETPPVITKDYEDNKLKYDFLTGKIDSIPDDPYFLTTLNIPEPVSIFNNDDLDFDNLGELEFEDIETENGEVTDTFNNTAQSVVDLANSFVGGRYVLGSQNPNTKTFDCSGLMNYIFKLHGINIPRTTYLLNKNGHRISKSEVRPGDLALFIPKGKDHGHVGLVSAVDGNNFTMIDARGRKYGIVKRDLSKDSVTTFLRYIPTNQNNESVLQQLLLVVPSPAGNISSFRNQKDYAQKMYSIFYNELERQGINGAAYAPLLVTHTAIESGWGTSKLSSRANNYGGIKGKGYSAKTKEADKNGNYYTINSSFLSYASIDDFARAYVSMLKNRFGAFNVNPSSYIAQIRSKGYFTAPLSKYQNVFNSTLNKVNKYINS